MVNIKKVNSISQLKIISSLANIIWPICYKTILTPAQLSYMVQKGYALPVLQNAFINKTDHFYIAYKNTTPIGYASISATIAAPCKLHKLYVLPTMHGNGAGKILFNFAKTEAQKQQAPNMFLNVNVANKAVGFYKKQGMEITETLDLMVGNGYVVTDYIMTLQLLH